MTKKDQIFELSRAGAEQLKAELEKLKTEVRYEIADRIKVALGFGDLSENSEYDEAKNAQAENEAKIAELENKIRYAKIINDNPFLLVLCQIREEFTSESFYITIGLD